MSSRSNGVVFNVFQQSLVSGVGLVNLGVPYKVHYSMIYLGRSPPDRSVSADTDLEANKASTDTANRIVDTRMRKKHMGC